jgi:cytochrome c-type biogenesis protein CcmH/NrfG
LSRASDPLRKSVRLAGDGQTDEAVDLLELTLEGLEADGTIEEIVLLSLHAAVLCEGGLHDERRARRILRRALQHAPTDTRTLLSLSRLYLKDGRFRVARDLLNRRRETDEEKRNVGLQEVIEAMLKQLAE